MSNADAELILTRGWGIKDIARIYGVPVHMLGDNTGGAKANFEQMGLEFVMYTLMPWVKRHAEANNRDFFTKKERMDGFYTDYDPSALMRGDMASRFEAWAAGIQNGILNPNECRAEMNRPPREGGDKYLEPMNMADGKTGQAIGKSKKNPPPEETA
jgi:HK97 family phage portal protein